MFAVTRITDEKTPPPLSTQIHFKLHIVVKRNEGKTLLGDLLTEKVGQHIRSIGQTLDHTIHVAQQRRISEANEADRITDGVFFRAMMLECREKEDRKKVVSSDIIHLLSFIPKVFTNFIVLPLTTVFWYIPRHSTCFMAITQDHLFFNH